MLMNQISAEQAIVLWGSRITFNDDIEKEIKTFISDNISWYQVFNMAIKNKVACLLWKNLKTRGYHKNIPIQLSRMIESYCYATKIRNEYYQNTVKEVYKALNENNIIYSPLKGGILLDEIYINYGIRLVNDIDILIKKSDAQIIKEILASLNFIQGDYDENTNTIIPMKRAEEILWNMSINNLFPYRKIINNDFCRFITLDFCFSLDLSLDTKPVDEMISMAGRNINENICKLKNSHFFVHLCCHLYKEATNALWVTFDEDLNLIKFCDVREFILQKMDDSIINEAVEFSNKYKLSNALYYTLYHLNLLYNDGYEKKHMDKLNIKKNDFLEYYNYDSKDRNKKWNKSFAERLFALSNQDELIKKPNLLNL